MFCKTATDCPAKKRFIRRLSYSNKYNCKGGKVNGIKKLKKHWSRFNSSDFRHFVASLKNTFPSPSLVLNFIFIIFSIYPSNLPENVKGVILKASVK